MFPGMPRGVPRRMPTGRSSQTPKALMALLATLVLNKHLQQGRVARTPIIMQPGTGSGNRMADLARMSLNMGRRPPGY